MRILVTFAVEAEFAPWRRLRKFRERKNGMRRASEQGRIFEAYFDGVPLDVLLTGIGISSCRPVLENYSCADRLSPDIVISSGLAGALKEDLRPGDLITARKARTLSNDANAEANLLLLGSSIQHGARPIEALISANKIVDTAAEKARLSFFGEAVDMESAIVMAHFASSGSQVATIRAVSDAWNEDLPLGFDRWLTPQGEIRPVSLVNTIVRRPGMLPNLIRFGSQSNRAAQKLASFLDNFVCSLPAVLEKAAMA